MIQNRERFLNQLAEKLNRERKSSGVKKPEWNKQPQWDVLGTLTQEELIDVLKEQCKVIQTTFKRVTAKELPDTLQQTIYKNGKGPIITTVDERNNMYGLMDVYEKLRSENVEVHLWNEHLETENISIAERANIGITFSDITLAESGTVTLLNNKYNSRSISLLPKIYIAIIPKDTIVPRLSQATQKLHKQHQQGQHVPSCVSFITGPSNSADIESNLVVGVHGPVKAIYIVVD